MKCIIEDCNKKIHSGGLCGMHRIRERRKDPAIKAKSVAYTKEWKAKNKEKHAAQQERYRQKHKKELTEYYNKWLEDNWDSQMIYRYARKQRVKQATPPWADLSKIMEIYKNRPEGHHVDHIVPINGANVCGLHIAENLQYLTIEDNLKKGNR